LADFIIGKFLVERGSVKDNNDGTFTAYYRIFYSDDLEKKITLYKGSVVFDGDQQKLGNQVNNLLTKLDNTALDNAIDQIDQVLNYLSGT